MPEPNNYILPNPAVNPAVSGFTQGLGLSEALQTQQDAEKQRQAQAQMQTDLAAVAQKPTVAGINQVMLKYPAVADKFKPALESATGEQKQSRINQASDVYAALLANRPEIAKSLLEEQATAAKNAGDEQGSKHASVMAQLLDSGAGAKTLLGSTGMYLSSAMGPDKFAETFSKLESNEREKDLHPSNVAKAAEEARMAGFNATIAGVKAQFAQPMTEGELEKQGWDVKKIKNDIDISKQELRIKAMLAAQGKETNDLKRQELGLKVQEAQNKLAADTRDRVSAVAIGQVTIDNMLSTAQRVLNADKSVVWANTGPVASKLWTPSPQGADFEEDIKSLGSQAFLSQLQSLKTAGGGTGLGALSDAEGKKLEMGLQNLSTRQSGDRLMSNVKDVQRLLLKMRENLTTKYGVPGTPSELRPGVAQKTIIVDF